MGGVLSGPDGDRPEWFIKDVGVLERESSYSP